MFTSKDGPLFILGAAPTTKVEVQDFFNENNPFAKLLKEPPYLRYMGWNMLTFDHPKIIDGQAWEVRNGDRKTFRFYRDGSLVAVVYADNSFLGWGQTDEEFQNNPKLNPLAVIEYVYEFVELYRNILENIEGVGGIRFELSIKNSKVGDKNLYIIPRKLDDPFPFVHGLSGKLNNDFGAQVFTDFQTSNKDSSKFVSFKILEELFARFSLPSNEIPYTKIDDVGRRYVDIVSFPES